MTRVFLIFHILVEFESLSTSIRIILDEKGSTENFQFKIKSILQMVSSISLILFFISNFILANSS